MRSPNAHLSAPAAWPYPRWVAHRGAGKLAPENTLAAFRHGASMGYRMFECDVKLSADGVPFLLHDSTLQRTTNAPTRKAGGDHEPQVNHEPCVNPLNHVPGDAASDGGLASALPWHVLSQLDAGSWHSRRYAGEPLPTLEAIARFCLHNHYLLNVEIKPTPGQERITGEVVAQHCARLWGHATVKPLLTSFEVEALEGARQAQPDLPYGLLLDEPREDWLNVASDLGCQAIVCNYALWNARTVRAARDAGFRTLSYTVNDAWAAQYLLDLGTDGIITDRIDLFSPADNG